MTLDLEFLHGCVGFVWTFLPWGANGPTGPAHTRVELFRPDREDATALEVAGGTDLAYELMLKAMAKGKTVVTANKAAISRPSSRGPPVQWYRREGGRICVRK